MTNFKPLARMIAPFTRQYGKLQKNPLQPVLSANLNMRDSTAVNCDFYNVLWSETHLKRPDRFNTWPLISELLPYAQERLELGPGLRPRLPISGTNFVDLSPPVIEKLSAHGGIAIHAKITDLPFADGKFDLVCALDVIEHVDDDRSVFSEVSRVLTADGFFIFSVPLHARFWTKFDEFVGHVRRYDPADLLELLATNGLVLERSAAYGMQPSNPRLLDFGLWCLKNRRQKAMWWYNNVLMPLGMRFQKRLKFVDGLIDAPGVDEIVLVCRKRSGQAPGKLSCEDAAARICPSFDKLRTNGF